MTGACQHCGATPRAHGHGTLGHRYVSGPCRACGELSHTRTRGYCRRCYMYWRNHGVARPAAVDLLGTARPCRFPGCRTIARRITRELCQRHYQAQWRRQAGQATGLYQERGAYRCCDDCRRRLPDNAPDFQTLCRPCSARWARETA